MSKTFHKNKEVKPVEPVQMKIHQSNTYRKDLSWLYFNNEHQGFKRKQMKDEQSNISVLVAYLIFPSSS